MNLRVLSAITHQVLSVEAAGAVKALEEIATAMQQLEKQRIDVGDTIRNATKMFQAASMRVDEGKLLPQELAMLRVVDPFRLVGKPGVDTLNHILLAGVGRPGNTAGEIRKMSRDLNSVFELCRRFNTGLDPFVKAMQPEPLSADVAEVAVWCDGETTPRTLVELSNKLNDWNKIFQMYNWLFSTAENSPGADIKLTRVEDGSVGFFVTVFLPAWGALMATIQVIMQIAEARKERLAHLEKALPPSLDGDDEFRKKTIAATEAHLDSEGRKRFEAHADEVFSRTDVRNRIGDNVMEERQVFLVRMDEMYSFYIDGGYVTCSLPSPDGKSMSRHIPVSDTRANPELADGGRMMPEVVGNAPTKMLGPGSDDIS